MADTITATPEPTPQNLPSAQKKKTWGISTEGAIFGYYIGLTARHVFNAAATQPINKDFVANFIVTNPLGATGVSIAVLCCLVLADSVAKSFRDPKQDEWRHRRLVTNAIPFMALGASMADALSHTPS